MSKDPAILFYTSDFLTGTMTMTNEEVGKYIRLLCLQHQKGRLTEQDMLFICSTYVDNIYNKFKKNGDGLYYNERLEQETIKRKAYSESRRKNISKRYEHTYVVHMENENENINEDVIKNKDKYKDEMLKILFDFKPMKNLVEAINWMEWVDYRAEIKKKLTPRSAKMQLKFLSEQPNPAKCIEQSIKNQWQGLFEEKNNGTNKGQATGRRKDYVTKEEYQSELKSLYEGRT